VDDFKEKLARALLGSGMAGQAADLKKLMPIYQQQKIQAMSQGQNIPEFNEWAKTYQQGQ
jgi:hypothetical protein